MRLFGKGGWGVTQDKGGLLVGGEGAPIWLAGVTEKGCKELDKIQSDMRGWWAFQNEVDLRASHSRQAVETYSRVISISLVVNYGEHVGGNGLMTLGPKFEKRHRVLVRTHCEVWREFVQVVTERQVVEKEVSMLSGGNVAGGW